MQYSRLLTMTAYYAFLQAFKVILVGLKTDLFIKAVEWVDYFLS